MGARVPARLFGLSAALVVLVSGCGGPGADKIDLSEGDVSRSRAVGATEIAQSGPVPFRLATAPVLSPSANAVVYAGLAKYLQTELGRPVEILQRRTHAEIDDLVLLGSNGADAALVCGGAYVKGQRDFGMEALVAPTRQGQPVHDAYLIVPRSSGATSIEDLRGSTFAFTDPLSGAGHIVPLYEVLRMGEDPGSFFGREIFTYGHDNSIRAVADQLVDAASVDSWVYDDLVGLDPALASAAKVIGSWGPIPSDAVVVNPGVSSAMKATFTRVLVDMSANPEGRRLLAGMGIDGFTEVDDSFYGEIRRMRDALAGDESPA